MTGADTAGSSSGRAASSSSNAAGKGKAREGTKREREAQQTKEKVISPELRTLLSRNPIILIKETAVESGSSRVS